MQKWTARLLSLFWAFFWVWFGLASGVGEQVWPPHATLMIWVTYTAYILLHMAVPGLVFLATAFAAWRWEKAGGIILILEGLAVGAAYPFFFGARFPLSAVLFVEASMALPPLVCGLLFIRVGKKIKSDAL